jgi:hypothetical protein
VGRCQERLTELMDDVEDARSKLHHAEDRRKIWAISPNPKIEQGV